MAKISDKLFDIFRNLKSDAIPRPPRSDNVTINEENLEQNDENSNTTNTETPEEIFIEPDELKKQKKKSKFKKTFFKSNKNIFNNSDPETEDRRSSSSSNVNTQASGNVINIVNSPDFHWGNNFTYYMGPKVNNCNKDNSEDEEEEDNIPKSNLIIALLESKVKPEHEYLDYIAKNLGKRWRSFFRNLGYTKGRIETVEIDEAKHGVSEARYKLLLDWARNSEKSLGHLATLLWDHGEKQVVKELSILYNKNQNN